MTLAHILAVVFAVLILVLAYLVQPKKRSMPNVPDKIEEPRVRQTTEGLTPNRRNRIRLVRQQTGRKAAR